VQRVSDDIVQWIGEQLDADAARALAASPGPWGVNEAHDEVVAVDGITVAEGFALSGNQLRATVDHIAEHDPARVLREIDAKRRIMQVHNAQDSWGMCVACPRDERGAMQVEIEDCPILRLLALPYADRPGYREEWRP
jgi:hypothetical protein